MKRGFAKIDSTVKVRDKPVPMPRHLIRRQRAVRLSPRKRRAVDEREVAEKREKGKANYPYCNSRPARRDGQGGCIRHHGVITGRGDGASLITPKAMSSSATSFMCWFMKGTSSGFSDSSWP